MGKSSNAKQVWRCLLMAALASVVLAVWLMSQAANFLQAPAAQPSQADLIVVLGGDAGDRGLTAARLFAQGMAPLVLLTGFDASPAAVRPMQLSWHVQIQPNGKPDYWVVNKCGEWQCAW